MITIDFSKRGKLGFCEFIYISIKKQILGGALLPDSKLPSKRALALNLGVSVITVQNAYAQLISEGFIYSIEKKGFFVTDILLGENEKSQNAKSPDSEPKNFKADDFEKSFQEKKSPENSVQKKLSSKNEISGTSDAEKFNFPKTENNDGQIPENRRACNNEIFADFTSNVTSVEKFPFTLWAHKMRQILSSDDPKLLQKSDVKGVLELRLTISDYLKDFRNMSVSPEQIVIGAGAENLYSILVQFLGREKLFAVENPGFKRTKEIFELNGAKCVPLEIDSFGLSPEKLHESGAQIAHLSPNHHFPTGIVMPVRRRMELLSWAGESKNHFIIEDDYDSEFRFNGKPLPTLQSLSPESQIIYMNTFSKTLSPSFRIGFMVLPKSILRDFEKKMSCYSCPVSAFEQFTLARFIGEGFYEKHINRMRNYYRNLRNSLICEMKKSGLMGQCEIQEEEAGLHFLLKIKSKKSGEEIKKALLRRGIKTALLSDFYYSEKQENPKDSEDLKKLESSKSEKSKLESLPVFVINYSGLKKEDISETVRRMCAVFG